MFRQVCSIAQTTSDRMVIMSYHNKLLQDLFEDKRRTKFVRRVPIEFDIPHSFVPNRSTPHTPSMIIDHAPTPALEDYEQTKPGLSEWRIETPNKTITLWRWQGMLDYYPIGGFVTIVKKDDLKSLYRVLIDIRNVQIPAIQPPVLPSGVLNEIYNNSIGFLDRGRGKRDIYKKHNIPYKRGILLSGKPGCGKTTTCKWLRSLCKKKGLISKVVTMENFKNATGRGTIQNLFRLPKGQCGLIFFDDMDIMVKDRKSGESNGPLQTFLTNLDGIDPTEGAVFIFTTNIIAELDEAFVRPGRIDLFITFRSPNKKIREKFVLERFDKELLQQVELNDIVERSNDYTFAELDEIRKLLIIDFIDGKEVSLDKTFKLFELHRTEFKERAEFGFGKMNEDSEDDLYTHEDLMDEFRRHRW